MEQCTRSIFLDAVTVLICLLTHIIDVVVGGYMVAKYLRNSNDIIASLIAILLVLPGVMTSILGCCWLQKDASYRGMLPMRFHVIRILSTIFLVSPFSWYVDSLYFLVKRYQARCNAEVAALQRVTDAMVSCMSDAAFLRLCHSCYSTAPSSVLQLYLLLKYNNRLAGYLQLYLLLACNYPLAGSSCLSFI